MAGSRDGREEKRGQQQVPMYYLPVQTNLLDPRQVQPAISYAGQVHAQAQYLQPQEASFQTLLQQQQQQQQRALYQAQWAQYEAQLQQLQLSQLQQEQAQYKLQQEEQAKKSWEKLEERSKKMDVKWAQRMTEDKNLLDIVNDIDNKEKEERLGLSR